MFQIAMQMLMGERVKYFILISALSFSTLLMTQQAGVLWGVMKWTTTKMRNTKVPIWVVDPNVIQINNIKTLRDTDLARVRSVDGVAWALPLYFTTLQAKLYNGDFIYVDLVGVDTATLLGVPPHIVDGKLENLWAPDGVIVDMAVVRSLSENLTTPLGMGDQIDINDREMRIVGTVRGEETIFGNPAIYTTYDRATQIAPPTRKTLSYILVNPSPGVDINKLSEKIKEETGLLAYTEENLFWHTIRWYIKNTGIPTSFATTILLGFIVGIAVSGQTFYSFVFENIGNFAALKAMGASNKVLKRMILIQAGLVGCIGYGIGLGVAALFGFSTLSSQSLPFALPWTIPVITFILILSICLFAAYLGIRKIRSIDPAEVFRG